jgi:hypothetical protein
LSTSATEPDTVSDSRRAGTISLVFFLLTLLALAVRICVSPELMDRVYDYVREGGAFYQKIHLGTYLLLALLPVVLFSRPVYIRGEEIAKFRDLVRFCGLLLLLIVFLFATGRSSSTGSLADTYLVAAVAGLVLLAQNAAYRRLLGEAVLLINMLSALMALFEVTTRIRIFPYSEGEDAFRPIGLAGHPLTLGLLCATSIGFVAMTRWKPWAKITAIALLFIGTAASGARLSLILATFEIVVLLLFVPWSGLSRSVERKAKLGVLIAVVVGGVALFALLATGGFLSRFSEGIVDDNFFARTDIYRIFEYTSWQQVWFGTDMGEILKIVNDKLNLPFIESTPVFLTYQLGLILAVPFAILVFWLVLRLLRNQDRPAWIGTTVFFLAALSNNTLNQKTAVVTILIVLLIAFVDPATRDRASKV